MMMRKWDLTKKGQTVEHAYTVEKHEGNYDAIFKNYKDPATRYAFAVLEGNILAGKMIKLDAFRHLQDLRRQTEDQSFKYHYDLQKCHQILNFAKLVPEVNAGTPQPLMLWQQKILCSIFGWRDDDGQVRYMRSMFSVARTNGKTYLASILMAYYFIVEHNVGGKPMNHDYILTAPSVDQADKGFNYLQTMFALFHEIPAFKAILDRDDVAVLHDRIVSRRLHNRILRKNYEKPKFDALHAQFAVGDEVGDDKFIGKIRKANGKITSGQTQEPNHSFLQISTAYPDATSQFYKDQRMLETAMKKDYSRKLDSELCMVWEQDSIKETEKPETWIKSNPLLGLSKQKYDDMMKSLKTEYETKMADGTLAEFQNKNLNMWLQVKQNTYLTRESIDRGIVEEAPIDINGHDVVIGFDKSTVNDDTSVAFMFPYLDKYRERMFYTYCHTWVPTVRAQRRIDIKEEQDGINYRHAQDLGFCTVTKDRSGYIDPDAVINWILDFVERHNLNVKCFVYDKWGLNKIIGFFDQKSGWDTLPLRQVIQNLSETTVDLRKQFDTGHIKYLNDPVMITALQNAVLVEQNNSVKIDKDLRTAKIDCADAIVDAYFVARFYFDHINVERVNGNEPFAGMDDHEINDYFTSGDFSF